MHLTVVTLDDRVVNIDVDADEVIENVKAICEAETGIPISQQRLLHNGQTLQDGTRLSAAGVSQGDLLMLAPAEPPAQRQRPAAAASRPQQGQQSQQGQAPHPAHQLNPDGSAAAPAAFIQTLKANPELMLQLEHTNPPLADAIRKENVDAMQQELRRFHQHQLQRDAALRHEEELAAADPFDVEAQRKIEELIQQKNIEENLAAALEHSPEVFGSVEMLYVNMEVNGQPVKAFIDSGAQMTIMTHAFAEKCYLTRLIDKRFEGMAVGVGSSKIIGRVHQAPLKVQNQFITTSITILEQKSGPQFIYGLDMLKRHQCCVDLARGVLRFGSCAAELPFLPEHEIPKDFKRHVGDVSPEEAAESMAQAQGNPVSSGGAAASGAASTSGAATAQPQPSNPSASAPSAPQAAPARSAVAPPPAAMAGGGSELEAKITRLMGLGFDRVQCAQALEAAGGNEDGAASILFGDM